MLVLTALAAAALVAAQTPGPDYPLCATISSHPEANGGFEVNSLSFQPNNLPPYRAILSLEVQNL